MRVLTGPVVVMAVMCGCSGASKSTSGDMDTVATVTNSTTDEGLLLQRSDLDGNGSPDVFAYYRQDKDKDGNVVKTLVKKSIDLNGDGKLDVTRYNGDAGELVREDLDLDFDGKIDVVRTHEKGKLKSEQISSLFDGRFDIRKFYEDGVLVLKQVDTRRNGTFDEFQYFIGNKLSRIGWDHDGDGKPEVFEDNPAVE